MQNYFRNAVFQICKLCMYLCVIQLGLLLCLFRGDIQTAQDGLTILFNKVKEMCDRVHMKG